MKIREIRCAGLRGATPEGGWSKELRPEDCVHTLVAVHTDEGAVGLTLITPEATTKLLVFMAASEPWMASLPVGGEDGTLGKRFRGEELKGRIRAKTGTLSHVSALGGYLEHPRLGRLAFTVLVNNYNTPASEVRLGIDKLVMTLLE